jgi:Peptidase family M23
MADSGKPTRNKVNAASDLSLQSLENRIKELAVVKEIARVQEEARKREYDDDLKHVKGLKGTSKKAVKAMDLDFSRADSMGRGSNGSVLGKLSTVWKGANNPEFASKALSNGGQAAATMLKTVASGSASLSNAMGMLTGSITPAGAALGVLAWATEQAVGAFVEGFNKMKEIQKDTAYKTNFTTSETGKFVDTFMDASKAINDSSAATIFGLSIARVTYTESMTTFQNVIRQFKDFVNMDNADRMAFAKLAVGLEEMGYSISGPIGEMMKTQYYRDNSSMKRTNELLNNLVGLSKSSTMSLDELVSIMGNTEQQNLNAWTLMRGGMSATDATVASTGYSTSKAAVSAAADTLGLSKNGVEAIYSMINDIITSATDPTKLGELTRKYQVGGMTGGKSITQIYNELASGNFTKVFKEAVQSASDTAQNRSGLGFEYLSSQFGSNISTVLGSFTPTVISKLFTTIDSMNTDISAVGEGNEIMGEIQQSIVSAPLTTDDILNSFFNEFTKFGAEVATFFTNVGNFFGFSRPKTTPPAGTTTTGDSATTSPIMGSNPTVSDIVGGTGNTPVSGTTPTTGSGITGILTGNDGQDSGFTISDYYANDNSGWFTNNDIKGTSPFKISAGFMAPAYKKRFGYDHKGVDYAAREGTPVTSPVDGVVTDVGYNSRAGNYVEVKDASGRLHRFQHLSRALVKPGDRISVGTQVGAVGKTGAATGPHAHYSVQQNGKFINPNSWAGTSFGGLSAGYGGVGGGNADTSNGYDAVATSNRGNTEYYNSTEIVNSINDLNSMLSNKLDVIINKMAVSKNLTTQFSYK